MDASRQSAGFDKSKRLLNSRQYRQVLQNGKRHSNLLFSLVILPNNQTHPRFGITVSKKVSKLAVERNRIKRQVREFFRNHQHGSLNYDFVLIAKASAVRSDNSQIKQALNNLWSNAHKQMSKQACN